MKETKTERGFSLITFTDRYGEECSLQRSSLATENAIWLGISEITPRILASEVVEGGTGWVKYPLPESVEIFSRMHLTQAQVEALLPYLHRFVETGDIL